MNKKYTTRLFVVVIILLGLWMFRAQLAGMWGWFGSLDAVTVSMQEAGLWGPAALAILFVMQVFLAFIPGQALMVACGYLYGFWGGFFLSWLSLAAGGELAFLLARKRGRPFAEKWISPDILSRWDTAARGQGIGFFFIMLVMPLVPNDAMCYVAGLGTISHRRFAMANLLGRGMACLITSAAGALGGNLSPQGWVVVIGLFVIVGIAWQIARFRKSNLLIA